MPCMCTAPGQDKQEAHSLCKACAQPVHSLCTACAQPVHSLCTACAKRYRKASQTVLSLGAVSTQARHVLQALVQPLNKLNMLCTACAQPVHSLCTACAQPVPVLAKTTKGVPRLRKASTLAGDAMPCMCTASEQDKQVAQSLCTACAQPVHSLCTACVQTVHRLCKTE
jgi:hypothetical protein